MSVVATDKRFLASLLALVMLASVAAHGARRPAPVDPRLLCDTPVEIPGLGPACPAPNGLVQVLLDDGTTALTHGLDPVPTHGHDEFADLTPRKPACASAPARMFHIQVIYARPSDQSDRYVTLLTAMRDMVYRANAMLHREAKETGAHSMRYRMACSGGEVSIARVNLGFSSSSIDFASVINGVRAAGHDSTFAKYWIWVDGEIPGQPNVGGVAAFSPDERLEAENASNFGPGYAMTFQKLGTRGASVMMHEASHSLGAVQNSAPNSTLAAHCIDDLDVMCYPDGGSRQNEYKPNVCKSTHYDCNHDDYFNARPSSSNYLRRNWNLASPLNRFHHGCAYHTNQLTAGTAGVDVDGAIRDVDSNWSPLAWRTHSIPSGCERRPFALSGVTNLVGVPGAVPYALSGVGHIEWTNRHRNAAPVDLDVCFYKGSTQLRCFRTAAGPDSAGTEIGWVPAGTTRARVELVGGAAATYVLSIV